MDQFEVSCLLHTYAERVRFAENDKQLKKQIKNLKELLDLRTIRFKEDDDEQADC